MLGEWDADATAGEIKSLLADRPRLERLGRLAVSRSAENFGAGRAIARIREAIARFYDVRSEEDLLS